MVPEPPRHRADAPGSWGHSHAPNAHDASSLPPSQLKRLDYHPGKGVGLFLAKLDRIKERYYFETEHETSVLFYAPKIRVREGSRAGRPHPWGRSGLWFPGREPTPLPEAGMATAKELEARQGGGGLGLLGGSRASDLRGLPLRRPSRASSCEETAGLQSGLRWTGAESLGYLLACGPRDSHTCTHTWFAHTQ